VSLRENVEEIDGGKMFISRRIKKGWKLRVKKCHTKTMMNRKADKVLK
jgi:hypothetical protein